MTSVQWVDQDAMNVLDEVSRRRYELNIMGRLSMSDDWRDSEVSSLGESHRSFRESSDC